MAFDHARLPSAGLRRRLMLVLVMAAPLLCAGAAGGQTADAKFADSKLIVTYAEAPVGGTAVLARAIQAYAARMRRMPAAPSVEVFAETERPARMVILERWPVNSAGPDEGRDALLHDIDGQTQAPIDRRTFTPLVPLLSPGLKGPFHMIMHVDAFPDGSAQAAAVLKAQRALVLAAPGGLAFEAGALAGKPNHFAVHEVWTSRTAYETYLADAGGQGLRQALAPFQGSPFDDRFYRAVPETAGAHK